MLASPREVGRKYGNRKAEMDNITFDSTAELHRYQELKILQQAGEIEQLQVHPCFVLQPAFYFEKSFASVKFRPDFVYLEKKKSMWHVEDVKGVQTEAFSIRMRLFIFWAMASKHFEPYSFTFKLIDAGGRR